MYEKVNPEHPDKVADRIAGAIVDLAYKKEKTPKIAVEVMIGHGNVYIVTEASCRFEYCEIAEIVSRITKRKNPTITLNQNRQDVHLAKNQSEGFACGDNGIFKGTPVTSEQKELTKIAKAIYRKYPTDGKYILNKKSLTICQSNASTPALEKKYPKAKINPLGDWSGGFDVDTGATNRKLGSDMGDGVTGGGLHGKDLSKADVSVNIYAFLKAQETNKTVKLHCSIGDTTVDGLPYNEIVKIAHKYIKKLGGFEKFAEWGLIR